MSSVTRPADTQMASETSLLRALLPRLTIIARDLARRADAACTEEDLVVVGMTGALEAVRRYQSGNVPLESFVLFRARGAMLDELRALDWRGRAAAERAKRYAEAREHLTQELEREPVEDEILTELGLEPHQLASDQGRILPVLSLEALADEFGDTLFSVGGVDLEQMADIKTALLQLGAREQQLLSLLYAEGLTQREVSLVLEISESRVSQLHAGALLKLRRLFSQSA